jgi:Lrp/AsnC family transcriptional regulator, leucine-responsive regulatory protein
MDDIDRKILSHIQHHGRDSYADIGEAAGLSVSAVNERLKKLQAQGAIRGWAARVDPEAVGRGVLAFIFVALARPEHDAGFRAAMTARDEIQECHHVTGDWSYLLKVRLAGVGELETLLATVIKAQAGVMRTHTMIALSSPKESAVVPCIAEADAGSRSASPA